MVVVFTIAEINYLVVSLFCDFVRSFRIYICGVQFFSHSICLVFDIATKSALPFLVYSSYFSRSPSC